MKERFLKESIKHLILCVASTWLTVFLQVDRVDTKPKIMLITRSNSSSRQLRGK